MKRSADEVHDYTCTFRVQERIDGELEPITPIHVKQRREPLCVYMKWIGEEKAGREVIHCPERYDGEMQVRQPFGVARFLGTVSLDPHGETAMKGNRHAITEAGLFHVVRLVADSFQRASQALHDGVKIEGIERAVVGGQPSLCWSEDRPLGRGYYSPRSEVCVHESLALPTRIRNYDEKRHLVEHYQWSDYRLNVGLGDVHFDVDNPEYGF